MDGHRTVRGPARKPRKGQGGVRIPESGKRRSYLSEKCPQCLPPWLLGDIQNFQPNCLVPDAEATQPVVNFEVLGVCGWPGFARPTPNLPTKIIPTKIRLLNISWRFPMDMRIPPLKIKILLENKPSEIQNLSTEIGRSQLAWPARRPIFLPCNIYNYYYMIV